MVCVRVHMCRRVGCVGVCVVISRPLVPKPWFRNCPGRGKPFVHVHSSLGLSFQRHPPPRKEKKLTPTISLFVAGFWTGKHRNGSMPKLQDGIQLSK